MANNVGWICPVCGSVNAPWVRSCKGKGQIVKYAVNTTSSTADMKFEPNDNNTHIICD